MALFELIGGIAHFAAAVSAASVSGADISATDISASDVSASDVGFSFIRFLNSISLSSKAAIILVSVLFVLTIIALELLRSRYVIDVNRRSIVINRLPKAFDGTRLVLISDLHQMRFGTANEELAKRIKREEPDYILFAGDMGDCESYNVDAFYDLLEQLGDSVPVVLAPGNEDLKLGGGRVHKNFLREVERAGAVMLNNACAEMTSDGSKIYIYGFCQPLEPKNDLPVKLWDNASIGSNDVLALLGKCPDDAPVILLAHDPRPFDAFRKWGADLVLSGHIQGGIIRLPFIGGLIGPSGELRPKYSAGLYSKHGSKLFVSRGLGCSGKRVRFLNPPEISVLTLVCRESSQSKTSKPVRTTVQRNSIGDVYKDSLASIKEQLGTAVDFIRSESRSIKELLSERLTQLSDFIDLLLGRKRSRFAIKADEEKRRHTYIAPKKKKSRSGSRYSGSKRR